MANKKPPSRPLRDAASGRFVTVRVPGFWFRVPRIYFGVVARCNPEPGTSYNKQIHEAVDCGVIQLGRIIE
jgi:hypothetical protein